MTEHVWNPTERTLGDFIANRFPDFEIEGGSASMDMDISNGIEFNYFDNRKHGCGERVSIYPYILWTDGVYKPCHYWGEKHYIILSKR